MRRLLAAVPLALAACAGAAPRPSPRPIAFEEPLVVEAGPGDPALAGKNDEELFAIGSAAASAGDSRRAAAAFARLADAFPASPRRPAALFRAGLAYRALSQWGLALERFGEAARTGGPDADEAAFRAAECRYNLRDLAGAAEALDALARRADLPASQRSRALDQRGIVELDAGDAAAAERSLRLAIATWDDASDREPGGGHWAAEARYYLGEIVRRRFDAVALDPSRDPPERLGEVLEEKARLLLAAQEQYLDAIRSRDPEVAVAAGFRIGELYDALFTEMTEAPPPPGLDAAQLAAYRAELRRRVRVLVTKAMTAYQETLDAAQRIGVSNAFVEHTRASLDRMRRALLDGDAHAEAPAR